MTNYINENSQYSIPNSICNTSISITIKKELFLDHLNKRQLEMVKNNEKTKLLKTLKHMAFPDTITEELDNIFLNKIYSSNETIFTKTNYLKNIFKYWEKEIENFKLLKDEINTISDIYISEVINADKIGYINLIDENESLNTITITCSFGNTNQNKDTYKIQNETNEISKEINIQNTYFTYEDGSLIEKTIPDKKTSSQVFSDTEILKLCRLSNNINKHFGNYKNIKFVSVNNKIYIIAIEDIKIKKNTNTLNKNIKWSNNFTDIKEQTNPLTFSIENIFFKNKIKTLTDIFYTYTPAQNSLVFYNNHIVNDSEIEKNIIKNSGVYLFNPIFFEQFFLNEQISNEQFKNSVYFMEAIKCYSKLYNFHKKINKKHENFLNEIVNILNRYSDLSTFTLEELLNSYKDVEKLINNIWNITIYNDIYLNIYTNMLKRKEKIEKIIFSDNTLINELNKISKSMNTEIKEHLNNSDNIDIDNYLKQFPNIKADIDIFINTYKDKYFISTNLESDFKINIYKLIANWTNKDNKSNININKNNISKRYSNCRKRQEVYFETKNTLYKLLNSIFKEIGIKLMLSGCIDSYSDICYLTVEEILFYTEKVIDFDLLNTIIQKRKTESTKNNIHTTFSHVPKYNIKGTIRKLDKNNNIVFTENDIVIVNTINAYTICSLPKIKGIIIDSLSPNSYMQWLIELLGIPYIELFNANNLLKENEEFEI